MNPLCLLCSPISNLCVFTLLAPHNKQQARFYYVNTQQTTESRQPACEISDDPKKEEAFFLGNGEKRGISDKSRRKEIASIPLLDLYAVNTAEVVLE